MVLYNYLDELRIRFYYIVYSILFTFSSIFIYREEFLVIFSKPFWSVVKEGNFMFTGISEVLQVYLALGCLGSLCSLVFYSLLNSFLFLLPGCYNYERIYLKTYLNTILIIISSVLFVIHNIVVKCICNYLLIYSEIEGIEGLNLHFEPRLVEFILFILRLDVLLTVVSFLLSSYLIYFFIIKNGHINRLRQWIYLSIIIIIITILPADLLLHLMILITFIVSFEILLIVILLFKNYEFAWWNR